MTLQLHEASRLVDEIFPGYIVVGTIGKEDCLYIVKSREVNVIEALIITQHDLVCVARSGVTTPWMTSLKEALVWMRLTGNGLT